MQGILWSLPRPLTFSPGGVFNVAARRFFAQSRPPGFTGISTRPNRPANGLKDLFAALQAKSGMGVRISMIPSPGSASSARPFFETPTRADVSRQAFAGKHGFCGVNYRFPFPAVHIMALGPMPDLPVPGGMINFKAVHPLRV